MVISKTTKAAMAGQAGVWTCSKVLFSILSMSLREPGGAGPPDFPFPDIGVSIEASDVAFVLSKSIKMARLESDRVSRFSTRACSFRS